MNPAQRQLARHALGLPNDRGLSYRNRYVVPEGTPAHGHWLMMVTCGWAREVRSASLAPPSGEARQPVGGPCAAGESLAPRAGETANRLGDAFCLTLEGAGLAVDPGEKLDPDDFVSIDGRAA